MPRCALSRPARPPFHRPLVGDSAASASPCPSACSPAAHGMNFSPVSLSPAAALGRWYGRARQQLIAAGGLLELCRLSWAPWSESLLTLRGPSRGCSAFSSRSGPGSSAMPCAASPAHPPPRFYSVSLRVFRISPRGLLSVPLCRNCCPSLPRGHSHLSAPWTRFPGSRLARFVLIMQSEGQDLSALLLTDLGALRYPSYDLQVHAVSCCPLRAIPVPRP